MKKNMKNPEKILPKMGLLLVEGADEKYFFIRACDAYGENNIQVMDFGGITDLPNFLGILKKARIFRKSKHWLLFGMRRQMLVKLFVTSKMR